VVDCFVSVLMTLSDIESRDTRGHIFRWLVPFDLERPKWRGKTCGRGLVFRGSAMPPPQEAVPSTSQTFGVPFYLCTHPLTQHYQI